MRSAKKEVGMDSKEKKLQDIIDCGIVAVVRTGSAEEAMEVCKAIVKGGIKHIDVTMTIPGAIDVIKEFKRVTGDEVVVGVGTVLDSETAKAAILAGAEFVVTPTLNLKIIEVCHSYDKIVMLGAFSPTEILAAWEAGADIVKVFPAGVVGPKYLKDIKGPLPQIRLMPTGGVNLENASDFIRAGAVAISASLVGQEVIREKKYDVITETAKKFIDVVKLARAG